ncbi:MAG: caspase family protein [Bacteroidota bacterium]
MKPIAATFFTLFLSLFATQTIFAQCQSGDCQNGDGVYVLPSGAKYYGGFKDGEIHGHGICKYPDESQYDGQWQYRFPDGRGTMTYADGSSRSGYWKRGQAVDMDGNLVDDITEKGGITRVDANIQSGCISGNCWNGKGIFAYPDGSKYRGDFLSGKLDGWGTFYYVNGNKYVGEFKRGLPDGEGAMHHPNGSRTSGNWIGGEFVGQNEVYSQRTGCVSGDCSNGQGVYVFPDGKGRYSGKFASSFPEGYGKVEYSNGDRYEGMLVKGKLHGKGVYYYQYGRIIEGYWKEGSYAGKRHPSTYKASKRETYTQSTTRSRPNTTTTFGAATSPNAPKVWAVIVGIANYNHMPILRYTDDDAYKMYAFFRSPEGGALSKDRMSILIDEEATKGNILGAMKNTFRKAGPNDLVILYFSGHGLRGSFLPIDYDGYNNKLYHEEINSMLKASPAKYKLCIADACHSGSLLTRRDGTVENMLDDYYTQLANSDPSTALIMSSKSEETSLESNNLRQGVFSHFLIRGMEGEADLNRDNTIGIQELFDFVSSHVRDYTGMRQSPIIQGRYDRNMPIAIIRR